MKKAVLLVACASALFIGCAGRAPLPAVPVDFRPAFSQTREVATPAKGERATAAIGSAMATVGKKVYRDAIKVSGPLMAESADNGGETMRFYLTGGTYLHSYTDSKGNRFFGAGPGQLVWHYKGKDGQKHDTSIYYQVTSSNELLVSGIYPDHPDLYSGHVIGQRFEVVQMDLKGEGAFRRELIYTGRTGNSLSLLYREYVDDMARPAFSQQLQYDISADSVIGFQGSLFRVVSTDNMGITYEVLEPLKAP